MSVSVIFSPDLFLGHKHIFEQLLQQDIFKHFIIVYTSVGFQLFPTYMNTTMPYL